MKAPIFDVATARGAPMGRGWDFDGQPGMARVVVNMYETARPRTDVERRHQSVAKAWLWRTREDHPCKVSLSRVRLNGGGYDAGGAYWGIGQPLYWAWTDDGRVDLWFRASDREAAKAHVWHRYPAAKFYR